MGRPPVNIGASYGKWRNAILLAPSRPLDGLALNDCEYRLQPVQPTKISVGLQAAELPNSQPV